MDLNRTPAQIADAAAEQLRALNHRTLDVKAFPQPGDASETVDALVRVVRYLPQALRQIEAAVRHLHDEERIRLADKPPAETSQRDIHERVFSVVHALEQARVRLSGVDDQMRLAAGPLSTMGAPWEDAEGDEDV